MMVVDFVIKILALAFLAESITEYFLQDTPWAGAQKYAAPAVGIFLSINFRLDLFAVVFGLESWIPYAGHVLTGVMLGRGANWLHDFFKRYVEV